ncbi:hypothetical protein BDZ97DRAFT_919961 [Flammula alnicola]|nr:hypothetical protein BDZ97DRAFT_919961 [Flammula alnicola]
MMEKSSGNTRNISVVRANPAQAVTLRKAFAISEMASAEQLISLSDETNLPAKWIHHWFGRQRAKARNAKSKVTGTSVAETSSPNTVLSPQEILHVKLENPDPVVRSSPPPAPEVASVSDYVALSTSSSAALEGLPTSGTSRKRKQKAPSRKTPSGRTLRSSKKKAAPVAAQPSRVKTEFVERPVDMQYTPPPADKDQSSMLVSGYYPNENASRIPHPGSARPGRPAPTNPYNQFLPKIAPPKRSPLTSANKPTGSTSRNSRSGLSTDQSESIYAPSHASEVTIEHQSLGSSIRINPRPSRSQRTASYQQGPVFHTQFHNNGPSNYASRILLPTPSTKHSTPNPSSDRPVYPGSVPAFYMPEASEPIYLPQAPNAGYYNVRPLAPAFDWENHVSLPSSAALSSNYGSTQAGQQSFREAGEPLFQLAGAYFVDYNDHQHGTCQEVIDLPYQPSEASQRSTVVSTIPDFYSDPLDPTLAPLKHLTDVLGRFKDEQGTYAQLLVYEERGNLLQCLLDDDLVKNSEFHAAMAVSLLSKLGVQWDY